VRLSNASAAALGMLADRVLGEPPRRLHPVSVFGNAMDRYERSRYEDSRAAGVLYWLLGAGIGVTSGSFLGSTAPATWIAVGGGELGSVAGDIRRTLERGDLEEARAKLPALVGRDPSGLDEKEIARAVVESVAENTVDAVVAPALWAAVAGAPGALGYRAVNTMDAMVGHVSERHMNFGWASAKVDDVCGWVPARLTALLVAAVRPRSAASILHAVRTQAPSHPSPNSGVAEAAFAAALGLALGGRNLYSNRVEIRPTLGTGRAAEAADIGRAVALLRDVTLALATLLGGAALGARAARSRAREKRSR